MNIMCLKIHGIYSWIYKESKLIDFGADIKSKLKQLSINLENLEIL